MKKKVLAIVLAVCMIASSCVLFASASVSEELLPESVSAGSALKKDNYIDTDGSKVAKIDKIITIIPKEDAKINAGDEKVTASNIDDIVEFKVDDKDAKFSDISTYFDIVVDSTTGAGIITVDESGTNATTKIQLKEKVKNIAFKVVTAEISSGSTVVIKGGSSDVEQDSSKVKQYSIHKVPGTKEVTQIRVVKKLLTFKTGVRFYGANGANLKASEIAEVKMTITRYDGNVAKTSTASTSSKATSVDDLMYGDKIVLTTALKDSAKKEYGEYYKFNCWVDASGEVLSNDSTYTVTMKSTSQEIYACYIETASRVNIYYSVDGKGTIAYNQMKEILNDKDEGKGSGVISVFQGKKATFTFVPDEGYEVSKVKVDGKDVISFMSLVNSNDLWAALKVLINASNKDSYTYTFTAEELKKLDDHTIEVVFGPIENFEAPSGLELPTVAAEGIELETGAADANGGEGGANGGVNGGVNGTTVPAENGGSAIGGVVNPATGSGSAIAVFAVMTVAAGAAFVTMKKKED